MALLSDLNAKRVEMNNAIQAYKQALADYAASSISIAQLDAARVEAQAKGDEFAKLAAQVKKDDPAVTNDDQLFSNPGLQNALVRDDIAGIMTTGQFLGTAMKLLVDTEGNAAGATNVILSFDAGSNIEIDWGDGSSKQTYTAAASHNYATPGQYEVLITGTVNGFTIPLDENRFQIKDVSQWGNVEFASAKNMFYKRAYFTISASDSPNFLPGCSCDSMFYIASNFNSNIGHWDVSNVTNMYRMFQNAVAFNQPLNSWDVSGVTTMERMFQTTYAFNQPLNNWNTANVTNMNYMFLTATVFNQDLTMWDVSKVTTYVSFNGSNSGLAAANMPNFT